MQRRRAFTLIELLVVVGIIATLTTIIMPSLAGARAMAQRVACLNNLHAVALGNASYAHANYDHYALAAEDMTGKNLKRWFGEREDIDEPFRRGGPMRSYLPGGMLKPCPSFRNFSEDPGQAAAFEAGCGGYGYNDLYIGGRFDLYRGMRDNRDNSKRGYGNSATFADVALSGKTVMFADTAFKMPGGGMMAYSFTHAPKWIPAFFGSGPNPPIHFRHGGMTNAAWVDCHATSEPMTYSAGYTTHGEISAADAAAIGLGWFGKEYKTLPDANYLFDLD